MWTIFLPYAYCVKKFVYMVVGLSIVAETTFPWYLKNDLAYWLQMSEHQFSKAVEAYKVLYLRNYAANVNLQ